MDVVVSLISVYLALVASIFIPVSMLKMSSRKRNCYSDAEKRRIVDGHLAENSVSKTSKAKFAKRIKIPVKTFEE